MDTAAMLEAGVGRFRGPSMAALVAEMWAPLAVALAAMATLPSLMRRLQMLILRLRSRGKEVISSHISTYYSSGDDQSDSESDNDDDQDDDEESSSGEEDDEIRRIGYYDDDECFPWGGAVVRTWQGLPRRFSAAGAARFAPAPSPGAGAAAAAIRLWGASTASGESSEGAAWWDADEGGRGASSAAEAPVVVGWRRDNAAARRRRLAAVLPSPN